MSDDGRRGNPLVDLAEVTHGEGHRECFGFSHFGEDSQQGKQTISGEFKPDLRLFSLSATK